jgi:hypothetical protein
MVGGLLFLPLSWEIFSYDRSSRHLRSFCEAVERVHADEEAVVLSEIFPHRRSIMSPPFETSSTFTLLRSPSYQRRLCASKPD